MTARASKALVGLFVALVALVVPIRTAWSAPEVQLRELPVDASGDVRPLPSPASHLGLRWIGDEDAELSLRWEGLGGWSDRHLIEVDHDLGDEATEVRLSGLVRADDATAVEVRVGAGRVDDLELVAIDTEHGPRHLRVITDAAGAGYDGGARVSQPSVIPRSQWGADESLRKGTPRHADVTKISVHHTVTPNDDPDPAGTVRAIYAYHTQSNGWDDIGYNFLVDASGRVYEGRWAREYDTGEVPTGEDRNGNGVVGAHTGGFNTGTVGIAVLGTYTAAPPPDPALRTVESMLAWEADRHDIDPLGNTVWNDGQVRPTVVGHRDTKATSCPGEEFYDLLPRLRSAAADMVAAANASLANTGYWELGRDGRVYAFGEAQPASSPLGATLTTPVVSMAATPTGSGYWVLSADGRVTPFGDAGFYGSTETMRLNEPVARLEPTPSGRGYWVLGRDGGIFSFGDAAFYGSTGGLKLNAPVISMAATPSGAGYWLLAADGGVFTFGDGNFYGSTGAMKLNAPVVSMAPHPSGFGYWLQASDGGIFSFGDVRFWGSVPGLRLGSAPKSVQIRATPSGRGYYVLGADGGIFTFGDARFYGAQPGLSGAATATDLALHYVASRPDDDSPTTAPETLPGD